MCTSSLYTLPTELLHRIIDYVDTETKFFSFRYVCKRFYTIIKTYNQYQLDFRSVTKPGFHFVCHLIQPENVVSLTLSDEHKTSGQIGLFLSLFDLRTFTRLRSLTLIRISEPDLIVFGEHITAYLLVSLSITHREPSSMRNGLANFMSSLTEKLNHLQKLDLSGSRFVIDKIQWPIQCPIRHLTLTSCSTIKQVFDILLYLPCLETFILDGIATIDIKENFVVPTDIKSQLKSLTIKRYPLYMNMVLSILSCTLSLTHLKLIGLTTMFKLSCNGYWWEEYISKNLPLLKIFEFFFDKWIVYSELICDVDIDSIISSFRTSFWLERHWYVTCNYYKNTRKLELYSIPICNPSISYDSTTNKISCSNFTHNARNMTDNVHSLSLNLIPTTTASCNEVCFSLSPLLRKICSSLRTYRMDLSIGKDAKLFFMKHDLKVR